MMLEGTRALAAYVGILAAAALESEVVYLAAATLVGEGHLNPAGVALAGATGAALGDQAYFFLLRGRLRHWLDRSGVIGQRGQSLAALVRRHEVPMVLVIRFAPGLRIALAAACAYAGVAPLKFAVLNGLASVAWAVGLLALVSWAGPQWLGALGLSGWWAALLPALLILLGVQLAARAARRIRA